MKPKPVRVSICPDPLHRPEDPLLNGWHKGWRLPDSQTIAFRFRGKWFADNGIETVQCADRESAITST
jgi:hypothetical protein